MSDLLRLMGPIGLTAALQILTVFFGLVGALVGLWRIGRAGSAHITKLRERRAQEADRLAREQERAKYSQPVEVFLSYSMDNKQWVTATHKFCDRLKTGIKLFDFRDIDPGGWATGTIWQERIRPPSLSGAKLLVVFIGERIGTELPTAFSGLKGFSDRLKGHGFDWIHVPGDAEREGTVPLTGTLYELFEAILNRREGKPAPEVIILMRGHRPDATGPAFGNAHWLRQMTEKPPPAVEHQRLLSDYQRQIGWLIILWEKFLKSHGAVMCHWVPDEIALSQAIEQALVEHRIVRPGSRSNLPLPALKPFGEEHASLFVPSEPEFTRVANAVLRQSTHRHWINVSGGDKHGKTSFIRAGLLPRLTDESVGHRRYQHVYLDVSISDSADDLALRLSEELSKLDFGTHNSRMGMVVEALARSDWRTATANLAIAQEMAMSTSAGNDVASLVIVFDQLETAVERGQPEALTHHPFSELFVFVASAGAANWLPAKRRGNEQNLLVSVITCVNSSMIDALTARVGIEAHQTDLRSVRTPLEIQIVSEKALRGVDITIDPVAFMRALFQGEPAEESIPNLLSALSSTLRRIQLHASSAGRDLRTWHQHDLDQNCSLLHAIDAMGEDAWEDLELPETDLRGRFYALPVDEGVVGPTRRAQSGVETALATVFDELMRRFIRWNLDLDTWGLRRATRAELSVPARAMAATFRVHSLVAQFGRDTLGFGHDMVVTGWKRAFDWLHEERADLKLEADLRLLGKRLVAHRADGDTSGERQLIVSAGSVVERAFDLYSRRGIVDQDASQFVNAAVEARAAETPEEASKWLLVSASIGNTHIAKSILAAKPDLISAKTADDAAAIHLASQNGKLEVVKLLEQSGASVDATTKDQFTPMHLAAQYGRVDVLRFLISKHARLDARTDEGGTPMHLASGFGRDQSLKLMIAEGGVSLIGLAAHNGSTPAHLAAQHGHLDALVTLREAGADLEQKAAGGLTALHLAVKGKYFSIVEYLATQGVNLEAETTSKETALLLALQNDDEQIAKLLVGAGANLMAVDARDRSGLDLALSGSNSGLAAELLLLAFPHLKGKNFELAMETAIRELRDDLVARLILERSWIEMPRARQVAHLMSAARMGTVESIRLLVDSGLSTSDVDQTGRTPLHWAVETKQLATVDFLLARGAQGECKDLQGETPFMIAVRKKYGRIADRIQIEAHGRISTDEAKVGQLIEQARAGISEGTVSDSDAPSELEGDKHLKEDAGNEHWDDYEDAGDDDLGTRPGTVRRIVKGSGAGVQFDFSDGKIGLALWRNIDPTLERDRSQFVVGSEWNVRVQSIDRSGRLRLRIEQDDQ